MGTVGAVKWGGSPHSHPVHGPVQGASPCPVSLSCLSGMECPHPLELVLILCQKKHGSIESCLSLCNAFFGCGSPILSDLFTGNLEKSDLNLQKCNRYLREVLYMLGEL